MYQLKKYSSRFLGVIALMLMFGFTAMAGDAGIIKGEVKDAQGQTIPGAAIKVMSGEMFVTGGATDIDGKYTIKALNPGKYDIEFSFVGYKTARKTGVRVTADNTTYVDMVLVEGGIELETAVIETKYEEPILNPTVYTVKTLDIDQIQNMAVSPGDVKGMIQAVSSDIMVSESGDIYSRGSRAGSSAFMIDGNRIRRGGDVPGSAIGGLSVLTGGVPAEYGDFTGALVIITTKDYMSGMRQKRMRQYDFEQRLKEKEAEEAARKQKIAEEAGKLEQK